MIKYFDIIVSMLETINNTPIYGPMFNTMVYNLMLVNVVWRHFSHLLSDKKYPTFNWIKKKGTTYKFRTILQYNLNMK